MPLWADIYKLFTYAFEQDPLAQKRHGKNLTGAGVTQPDAIPDIRGDGSFWGGNESGQIRLRDTNDFVDLSTTTNRNSRYKEYTRLRNVAEIEAVMTVIADEACIHGRTKIATLRHGFQSIRWLTDNWDGEPFLVYCYDFEKADYTLGWAYDPRLVKRAKTVKIKLNSGDFFCVTHDHRILLRDGTWIMAGELRRGDELMGFHRVPPNKERNDLKTKQFHRIFSYHDGWKHERQFIDEWRNGGPPEEYEKIQRTIRLLSRNLNKYQIEELMGHEWKTLSRWIQNDGYTAYEVKHLSKKYPGHRRVIGVREHNEVDVFDLSVEDHHNFCTDSVVMHNCQKGENGHVFEIETSSEEIKKELEFLFFHRKTLNLDRRMWNLVKNLCIYGDHFMELVVDADSPKDGIAKLAELPPDSMYRIETTKQKLVEFQQSKEGPDYQSLIRNEVTKATEADLDQATAIRFAPNQVVHFRIGDDRQTFYPYGVSLVEPARGPAHQLRLMEDAMVVYRLTRAPERRVFYIDVGQLPPHKAEAFIERMKDQFRKKKVGTNKSGGQGAGAVEERWHAPAADEDYWLPMRQNSSTKIDTLPGAQNLGEIDDALYFRNKLFVALNFPKNYFSNDDPQATRITLSAQDVKFARMIERIQSHVVDGLIDVAERHLELRGFPEDVFEDLKIKMTPPSDWKELSGMEVINGRIQTATGIKGSMLMGDYDILTKWMKYSDEEAEEIIARNKIQKYEDAKLQIIMQNPTLLGVGVPGPEEQEMGVEAGGPNPMLGQPPGPEGQPPPGGEQPPGPEGMPPEGGAPAPGGQPPGGAPAGMSLPEPNEDQIKQYDLEIQSYSREQDVEDIDYSETD